MIKKFLLSFGFEIHKKDALRRSSLNGVLENLKINGCNPGTVIDVGAAFGSWSSMCATFFPKAHFLLIEPLVEYEAILKRVSTTIKNADVLLCGISSVREEKTLYVHPDLVGSSVNEESEPHTQQAAIPRTIPCKTLDEICEENHLQSPYLIKLDIQGAELEAIAGAKKTLAETDVCILEVSLIGCMKDVPLISEVIRILNEKGFVVYDIFGLHYRPLDHALAQVDIIFVPTSSPLLEMKWYANETQRQDMNKKCIEQLEKKGVWIQ